MNRSLRRTAAALAGASALALAAGSASAHTEVTSSSPAHGSKPVRPPATMTVTFGEPLLRAGTTTMTRNGVGNLVKSATIAPGDARTVVIALKRPGPRKHAGVYRLRWRATGADGHAVTGLIVYRVVPKTSRSAR